MSRSLIAASAAVTLAAFTLPVQAEKRQLGPHEHGHGTLNIAIEGKKVAIELDVPGADIAGFEHEATTPEDKAQLEKAQANLKEALKLFVMPAAASCKLAKAEVELEAEHEHEHEEGKEAHEDHDHEGKEAHDDHEGKEAHEDHDHEGKEAHEDHDHEEGARHSEFNATYELDCASPKKIETIQFDYFKVFPNARSLTVNLVSDAKQGSYEVTSEKPVLDLTGNM